MGRRRRPCDEEVGVAFYEHFGVADDVDREGVGSGGLEFGEALTLKMEAIVGAVERDAEFVGAGRKRAIEV